MSEKRFIWKCDDETCHIFDTVTKARYFYEGIMNLLNEQQATIEQLQEELELTANTKLFSRRKLEEENEQLQKEVKNRSAFIIDKGLGDTFVRWKNER